MEKPCKECPWTKPSQPDISKEVREAAQNGEWFACHTKCGQCSGSTNKKLIADKEPPCNYTGVCESDATRKEGTMGNCIHCGGEMFKEKGFWFHHTQEDIPFDERGTVHTGI